MSANLVVNGDFRGSDALDDWTVTAGVTLTAGAGGYVIAPYAVSLSAPVSDASLYQSITTPGSLSRTYRARLQFMVLNTSLTEDPQYLAVKVGTSPSYAEIFNAYVEANGYREWYGITLDIGLQGATTYRLTLLLPSGSDATVVIDDIKLFFLDPLDMSAEGLARELQRRRRDPVGIYHEYHRYRQIVNEAIAQAPRRLWKHAIDTSLSTTEDVRRYSLSTLTDIATPDQVLRVWLENSDGNDVPIGRWYVEDNAGSLTLVLDEDPGDALTITLEYDYPYEYLDTTAYTDETDLDRQWLVAKAMSLLYAEADPALEPMDIISLQMRTWDQMRQGREQELRGQRRRVPGRIRTQVW